MQVSFFDNTFTLNSNKTLFWHDQDALIIADVHLGKSTHFRKNGLALPHYFAQEDFFELNNILQKSSAVNVFFLGDLFHSEINDEWAQFENLIQDFENKKFFLISGNHDVIATEHYTALNIKVIDDYLYKNIYLTHEPTAIAKGMNICGHIHPGIVLQKGGHKALRLPCFFMKDNILTLPALGATTGLAPINEAYAQNIWLVAENEIIKYK